MRKAGAWSALGAIFAVTMAHAAPVDTSLRPQARPGSGLTSDAAVMVTDSPVSSLRPVARPADLSSASNVIQVSTSNSAFQRWIDGFRGRARAEGISSRVFDQAFRGVRYNTSVIQKDRNQSEFNKQIWDYLDSAANPKRVQDGQRMLRRHGRTLDAIERHYGVEKEVVLAVWGMESSYGDRRGTLPVIESLATLAFDGRRGKFFESQLVAALKILQSGDVTPGNMKGSWAGAMGHTQFIPTSYEAYAVDFTGDGKRDIWSDDPTDALASTAAYLKRFGWTKGQPWGVEVKVPKGFSAGRAKRSNIAMPSYWATQGVVGMDGKPIRDFGQASIMLPAGTRGPAFMVFDNFRVIERYNNADAYVIGVGHLSDRIKGGPAIQASWPRGYKPLTFNEKKELQRRLKRKGFAIEKIDGLIGPNTVGAIQAFQRSISVKADGYPSQKVIGYLRNR